MVVFSEEQHWFPHKDYWKLRDYSWLSQSFLKKHLDERGYAHTPSAGKARLLHLASRQQRGLLAYDGCNIQELITFSLQRRLDTSDLPRNPTKLQLRRVLEQADEEDTFDRFTDLPAELRHYIYTLHFQPFPIMYGPEQPPIARTSTLIRKEALSTLYKTCTFMLDAVTDGTIAYCGSSWGRPDRSKDLLFKAIDATQLGLIRRVMVEGEILLDNLLQSGYWLVDCGNNIKQVTVSFKGAKTGGPIPVAKAEEITDKLMRRLKAVEERPGGRAFEMKDLRGIQEVFDEARVGYARV